MWHRLDPPLLYLTTLWSIFSLSEQWIYHEDRQMNRYRRTRRRTVNRERKDERFSRKPPSAETTLPRYTNWSTSSMLSTLMQIRKTENPSFGAIHLQSKPACLLLQSYLANSIVQSVYGIRRVSGTILYPMSPLTRRNNIGERTLCWRIPLSASNSSQAVPWCSM